MKTLRSLDRNTRILISETANEILRGGTFLTRLEALRFACHILRREGHDIPHMDFEESIS